ncbi:hypothetical protein [Spiroplasma ixodetis]|uniref:Uncharacterized protein n=1 Tax=Spiroplasma ixodetis TaxID=2141 RepID=A0ABN7BS03_9MOLU
MQKILNLITLSTLTTVFPTPLLSNILLIEKVKQDVGKTNSNNEYVPLRAITRLKKTIFSLAIDGDGTIWAIIDSKVNKSTDNGKTFNKVINGFPIGTYTSSVNSLTIDINGTIWVATTNYEGLYKSTDNGKTFQQIKIKGFPSSQIDKIAVSQNGDIYASKQDYIYKYIDNGKNFEKFYSFQFLNQIKTMNIQNNGTIWVGTNKGLYVFSAGIDTPTKLNDRNILAIDIDKTNTIYFGMDDSLYNFSAGSDTPTKIDGINDAVSSITFDKLDNVYFETYTNILNILQTALSWTKEKSQFNLIDSTKKKIWTRNDLLTVDGELNIEIKNNNIDKVLFDNVLQTQTAKQWNINVKPKTSEKDHNLQVIFILDGKQYTSQIIVSMQAKIDPPIPPKQENLSDVIKFDIDNKLGNILDNNNETIISAITQKNSRIIDFSQIEIEKKDMHSATLTAKKDSKSYQGSVVVKYNVVPATVVDLKIDLKPT